jgi:hypothetical protein
MSAGTVARWLSSPVRGRSGWSGVFLFLTPYSLLLFYPVTSYKNPPGAPLTTLTTPDRAGGNRHSSAVGPLTGPLTSSDRGSLLAVIQCGSQERISRVGSSPFPGVDASRCPVDRSPIHGSR